MPRRIHPFLTSALLVLYAGTMLLGQALHQLSGCDHHDGHSSEHAASDRPDTDGLSANDDDDHHDADSCPICQFHTQAQLGAPVAEICWHMLEGRDLAAEGYVG